jgi:hypothetical protein
LRRLRRFRRCGAQQLRTRIHDRLLLGPRGLILLDGGDTRLRGATTNLLHRRGPLGSLEPAFAAPLRTIDPALTFRRRRTGSRQALPFRGSGLRGRRGRDIEQVCKRIRRCRRSRETCEKHKNGDAKSQMTGHENPSVAPPRARPLAATWVTMRLKSGKAVDSFWLGNENGARVPVLAAARKVSKAASMGH